jgi:hypothetical protein
MRYPIAAGLGIALWFTGCSGGPKRLSGPGYLASQKAVDAINRAYEYRDEGEVHYDPRCVCQLDLAPFDTLIWPHLVFLHSSRFGPDGRSP